MSSVENAASMQGGVVEVDVACASDDGDGRIGGTLEARCSRSRIAPRGAQSSPLIWSAGRVNLALG